MAKEGDIPPQPEIEGLDELAKIQQQIYYFEDQLLNPKGLLDDETIKFYEKKLKDLDALFEKKRSEIKSAELKKGTPRRKIDQVLDSIRNNSTEGGKVKLGDLTGRKEDGDGNDEDDTPVVSVSAWGSFDLDKPVGQWTIEECASYLMSSRQQAKEQKGPGPGIYAQFEKLKSQLERPQDQQFWTVYSAMYDIAIAYESPKGDDYSINQGKFFEEGIEAGTKRIERVTVIQGITYHPVWGEPIRNTHKIIMDILLGKHGVGKDGDLCAAKLNVSRAKKDLEEEIRSRFKEQEETRSKLEEEYEPILIGSEKYPEHAFKAAILYGQVFDFRHRAFLEAVKRATTRSFGGEDPSWYDNPYAVLSYYLVRYAMIPDSKALLLLLSNVEEESMEEGLPLPKGWVTDAQGESRARKVERIKEITELMKEFYDVYIDIDLLMDAFRESGFRLHDRGSIFPTIAEMMEPIPEGYRNSNYKSEIENGDIKFKNLHDISLYAVAKSGWKDVMDAVTGPIKPMEGEEAVREINKFNRAMGRAKMIRAAIPINVKPDGKYDEDFDSNSYMKMMEPLALMYYVRIFQSLHPTNNSEFHNLRSEILDKLSEEGGAEGVPSNVRSYLFNILENKKFLPLFRVGDPNEIKKIKYLHRLNKVAKEQLEKMGPRVKISLQMENSLKAIRGIHKMRVPFTSWGVEKSTKE